jgi:hypothetical protein
MASRYALAVGARMAPRYRSWNVVVSMAFDDYTDGRGRGYTAGALSLFRASTSAPSATAPASSPMSRMTPRRKMPNTP